MLMFCGSSLGRARLSIDATFAMGTGSSEQGQQAQQGKEDRIKSFHIII
jgi:hypothetical protein